MTNEKTHMSKKILKAIIIFFLAILLAIASFAGYVLYRLNCNKSYISYDYNSIYAQQTPAYDVGEDAKYTVLKINDTHFLNGTTEYDGQTLSYIKAVLDNHPCDFIVIDGDLVEGATLDSSFDKYQAIDAFASMLEETSIPWTFAPGNNDCEFDGNDDALIAFMMQYPHFVYGNAHGLYGEMQLFIDLTYQGKTAHSLAILDSGTRNPKLIGKYEDFKKSQIDWLLAGINERKVPTSVFFHMPTSEFELAYDNGKAYKDFAICKTYPYTGDYTSENKLFDEMTKTNEYIKLISCGHIHSNNMCSFYNDRWYQLSSSSGYGAARDDFIVPSVTMTTIDVTVDNPENMYTFEQINA